MGGIASKFKIMITLLKRKQIWYFILKLSQLQKKKKKKRLAGTLKATGRIVE